MQTDLQPAHKLFGNQRAVAGHLAAIAVELSPMDASDVQELVSAISAAARPFIQMLDVEDLNVIYGCRSDRELDYCHAIYGSILAGGGIVRQGEKRRLSVR